MSAQPVWNTELTQDWPDHEDKIYNESFPIEKTIVVRSSLYILVIAWLSAIHSMFFCHRIIALPAGEADEQAQVLQQA